MDIAEQWAREDLEDAQGDRLDAAFDQLIAAWVDWNSQRMNQEKRVELAQCATTALYQSVRYAALAWECGMRTCRKDTE